MVSSTGGITVRPVSARLSGGDRVVAGAAVTAVAAWVGAVRLLVYVALFGVLLGCS